MPDTDIHYLISGNLPASEVLFSFLQAKKLAGKRPRTLEYYQSEIFHFLVYLDQINCSQIRQITPSHLRDFLFKIARTRNQGGVHAMYRALRAMFLWYEAEYEPENWKNPIRKVQVDQPKREVIPGITREDFKKLMDACAPGREQAILMALLDTCARATEFINLDVGDINLITGSVTIRVGKGGDARFVSFGAKTRRQVRRYLKARQRLSAADPLFLNRDGGRFTYNGLYAFVRWRAHLAGIPAPGLHDIRRAGALELLRNGANLPFIAHYLGHKSVEVTMRYLGITPDDIQEMFGPNSPMDNLQL